MRILAIAITAAFLALPTASAQACGAAGQHSAKAAITADDYSAARKKKAKKPKEKVEYMRAAPMK